MDLRYNFYPILDDFTPDWEILTTLLSQDTKALFMVHYFGQPQDINVFKEFCYKNNLLLIEDNAHGHGGEINGKLLGKFGEVGFSSPRKHLNTICGGIIFSSIPIFISVIT